MGSFHRRSKAKKVEKEKAWARREGTPQADVEGRFGNVRNVCSAWPRWRQEDTRPEEPRGRDHREGAEESVRIQPPMPWREGEK